MKTHTKFLTSMRCIACTLVLLTSAACASLTTEKPFINVGLHMAGNQPFCVYDVQFTINGGNRNHDRDVSYMCTNKSVGPSGMYLQSSAVDVELPKKQMRTLEVRYRRTPDSPQIVAVFILDGKLEPQRGYNAFSIRPRFSEEGIALVRTDQLYDRDLKHSKFNQVVVDYKGDK